MRGASAPPRSARSPRPRGAYEGLSVERWATIFPSSGGRRTSRGRAPSTITGQSQPPAHNPSDDPRQAKPHAPRSRARRVGRRAAAGGTGAGDGRTLVSRPRCVRLLDGTCRPRREPRDRAAKRSTRRHRGHARARGNGAGTQAGRTPPACEDGSTASAGAGVQTCADGSEPQCPAVTTAELSSAGTIQYCTPETEPSTPFDDGGCKPAPGQRPGCGTIGVPEQPTSACADGAPATASEEGDYTCPDGGEPQCPEGSVLTISADGSSLVCDAAGDPAAREDS
jgi:hypothetical protein